MGPYDRWSELAQVLRQEALQRLIVVDVGRAIRAIDWAVREYHRRRTQGEASPVDETRSRLRRLWKALRTLDGELSQIQGGSASGIATSASRAIIADLRKAWPRLSGISVAVVADHPLCVVYPREDGFNYDEWRVALSRMRSHIGGRLLDADMRAKRGPARDAATARLLLDVALALAREGLLPRNGGYPLTFCARHVVRAVGLATPKGKGTQKKLKPIAQAALRIIGARGGSISSARTETTTP